MLLEVQGLEKTYPQIEEDSTVLKGVSFSVEEGDFVAIMGPSGSGKSTLMGILGCLDRPTAGSYRLAGTEVSKLKDNQLAELRNHRIGFVFQNFQLLPRSSALDNVELPLIYNNVPRRERISRAKELLVNVGLGHRFNYTTDKLSGGQRQRVAIARALINEPDIILADEPTGNLDSVNGAEIMKIFTRLNQDGATIILVTHDPEIANFANKVIYFKDGHIENIELKSASGRGLLH